MSPWPQELCQSVGQIAASHESPVTTNAKGKLRGKTSPLLKASYSQEGPRTVSRRVFGEYTSILSVFPSPNFILTNFFKMPVGTKPGVIPSSRHFGDSFIHASCLTPKLCFLISMPYLGPPQTKDQPHPLPLRCPSLLVWDAFLLSLIQQNSTLFPTSFFFLFSHEVT